MNWPFYVKGRLIFFLFLFDWNAQCLKEEDESRKFSEIESHWTDILFFFFNFILFLNLT